MVDHIVVVCCCSWWCWVVEGRVLWREVGCCGVGCSVSVCRRTPEIHGLPTLFLVVGVMVVLTFVVANFFV